MVCTNARYFPPKIPYKRFSHNVTYWLYQYDELGQVTSGIKYTAAGAAIPGQSFGFVYDNIGNRSASSTKESGKQGVVPPIFDFLF